MIKKILIKDKNHKIIFPRLNDYNSTFKEIFGSINQYEFNSVIKPILKSDDIVIDCGAHIGLFSLLVYQYVNTVYSFEADYINFGYLKMNLKLNNIRTIKPFNLALSKDLGDREFLVSSKSPACHSFYKNKFFNDFGESAIKRKVYCITLEEIFKKHNISYCKLLKMDIEGAEFDVLLNTPEYILKKIGVIILEIHNGLSEYNEKDIIKKLEKCNFKTKILFGFGKDDNEFLLARFVNNDIKNI
jgi:FkbM family methyltransferase